MILHSHIACCEPGVIGLGSKYNSELAEIDSPGTEFYVPYPDDKMSCDAVAANMQLLNTFINVWNARLNDAEHTLIRNRTTISNCQAILKNLTAKLGQYQVKQNVCDNPPPPPPEVIDPTTGGDGGGDTGGGGSSNGVMWLLLGVGAFAFYKTRQNKKRRAAR